MCQPMQSTLYDWFHLILTKFYEVGAITVILFYSDKLRRVGLFASTQLLSGKAGI